MTAPALPEQVQQAPQQPETAAEAGVELLALVKAQAAVREEFTGQITALVERAVESFTDWYDRAAVAAWAQQVAGRVEPLLRVQAQNTDAYLARVLSLLSGRRVRPGGAVPVDALRAGVSHADAYARAATAYRWQQTQLDEAARALAAAAAPEPPQLVGPLEAALQRAAAVADMDSQLAVRQQSTKVMVDAHRRGLITGWRRVIHPELAKGGSCGLCVAASDRLYGPKEPMPLHAHCNCVPMPVYDDKDPGSLLNDTDLRRLYSEAGSTGAADLKRSRYKVTEHGELGPLLSPADGRVRTRRQVSRDTKPAPAPKTPEQVAADLRRVRDSLTPALDKARVLAEANPKKWAKYAQQLEARIGDLDHQLAA